MLKLRLMAILAAGMLLAPGMAFTQQEPAASFTGIEAVTLYPSSAKVEVKNRAVPEKLPSGEVVLVVYLPGYAYPNTVSASIDGKLAGMNIERLAKEDDSDPILAPWKKMLLDAQNEHAALKAEQEGVQARIAMWSNPASPQANLAPEMERLDKAMQAGLKAANARMLELAPLLEKAQKKIAVAEKRLESLAPSYKISFVLAQLRSGSDFTYSYMLGNCGWRPSYTLNALPGAEKVELGFSAEITQNSGFDWRDVKTSLATNAPRRDVTPPELDPWRISQMQPPAPAKNKAVAFEANEPALARLQSAPELRPEGEYQHFDNLYVPEETLFATYSIWDMGKRTITDGAPAVFTVTDETFKADFLYTARPKVSDQAFLTAELKPAESERIMPRAEAVYMVEGNTVGNGYYPAGESLYFGTDPLVKVSSTELSNQSDERGLIGKTQVRNWQWKYEVENLGSKPITLRVEDSAPSLGDARMQIKLASNPAPEADKLKSRYVWRTTLAPQSKFEIEHRVEASAPADVGLDSNR